MEWRLRHFQGGALEKTGALFFKQALFSFHVEVLGSMPTYEYRCERCGDFEVLQKISEDALKTCPTCGEAVKRLLSAAPFHLKGSGWYKTDYSSSSSASSSSHSTNGTNGASAAGSSADKTPTTESSSSSSTSGSDSGSSTPPAKSSASSKEAAKA